jgi:hypothetical protein
MRKLFLALLFLMISPAAYGQGCGSTNPNCIVPTAPPGTSNNQAASTAFVQQAIGGIGGSPVTSVSNADGTLTIAPISGPVVASLNLANANTWSVLQTFSTLTATSTVTFSGLVAGVQVSCLGLDALNHIVLLIGACGSGGGGGGFWSLNGANDIYNNNSSGQVIIGNTATVIANSALQIYEDPDLKNHLVALSYGNHPDRGTLTLAKTRGAVPGTNTVLQDGDNIGAIRFQGADGSSYIFASAVGGVVEGTVSAGHVPSRLTFATSSASNINVEALRINSAQDTILGPLVSTTDNARLNIYPAASSLQSGFYVTQTVHGTAGSTNCSDALDSINALNCIDIPSDDGNFPSGISNGEAALAIAMKWGGSNHHGSIGGLYVSVIQTAADASTSNPDGHNNVAAYFTAYSNVNVGGTNIAPLGANFAMNPKCHLGGGATDWERNICAEVDVESDLGSSVDKQVGWLIYEGDNHHSRGVTYDAAYAFSGTGVGFFCGFCATDIYGNGVTGPIPTTGIFIGTEFRTAGTYTIGTGIDLRGFNMTTEIVTNHFKVGGAGQVFGAGFNIFGGVSGATCGPGPPSGAFHVTGGIVDTC